MSNVANDYVKRIQSWVTRQLKTKELDIKCSMDQVRGFYLDSNLVVNPESPTAEEYNQVRELVLGSLFSQTVEDDQTNDHMNDQLAIEKIEEDNTTSLSEVLDQSDDQSDDQWDDQEITPVSELEEMLREGTKDAIIPTDNNQNQSSLEIQQYVLNVQEEVEKYFPEQKKEVYEAIIEYVENKAFSSANELKEALDQISQAQLDVFLKIADDHNKQQETNHRVFQERLTTISDIEEKKSLVKIEQRRQRLIEYKQRYGIPV